MACPAVLITEKGTCCSQSVTSSVSPDHAFSGAVLVQGFLGRNGSAQQEARGTGSLGPSKFLMTCCIEGMGTSVVLRAFTTHHTREALHLHYCSHFQNGEETSIIPIFRLIDSESCKVTWQSQDLHLIADSMLSSLKQSSSRRGGGGIVLGPVGSGARVASRGSHLPRVSARALRPSVNCLNYSQQKLG